MKKILVISSGLLPIPACEGGAVENLTENMLKYNENHKDIQFVVYSKMPKKKIDISNWKYTEFRFICQNIVLKKLFGFLSKISKKKIPNYFVSYILKDLKKRNENYDYVLIENMPLFVIYFKKIFANRIILHVHNDWLNINSPYATDIVNSCYKIIAVSNYVKNRVLEINANADVVTLINGIDNNRFRKILDKEINDNTRKQYGIMKNEIVFLYTGKLKPEKGAYEVIKAFSILTSSIRNIKLIMVGSSFNKFDNDTKYITKIKEIAEINKNIIFTGFVDYEHIHKIYSIADIQIVPSQCEDSCPLVVLEGLASGLALITSISGGIPELVNSKCSIQISRGKNFIVDLVDSMKKIISDDKWMESMKKESLKKSKEFTNDNFCSKFIEILK